jgi:trehalose 6-phosphate synthase/phosphatase
MTAAGAEGRVVVVSNRLPLTLRRVGDDWRAERSAGGLASALRPLLQGSGGLWIGWPGEAPRGAAPGRRELLARWERRHGMVAVDLPPRVARDFYEGYSNQTLWPLFHHFPSRLAFAPETWDAYVQANQAYLETLLRHLRPNDRVWIHDYHLMLLPVLLRRAAPEARIGFFLHVPFPTPEVFRVLPRREELLRGLLGADLVAFQTHGHLQHFRASLLRLAGIESRMDCVESAGRSTRLEALPIGIAPEDFTAPLDEGETAQRLAQLRRRFAGRRLLLAVDRLDYTKGIPERLRTFRRLLERSPELRDRVVLLQVAVPSRERIPRYEELRHQVNGLVGEINGDFGTPDWTPVVFIRRPISRGELVALYAAADVGWVTPLRDGMNLVAKEYVACQRGAPGVLLLSEFAGAAAEMGEALLVNPYDEDRTAAALERALTLPEDERRERMEALGRRVARNNVFAWSRRFLDLLGESCQARAQVAATGARPLQVDALLDAYRASRCAWLLLDYDGTLVPFAGRPREAVPPAGLRSVLGGLGAGRGRRVALVSGRSREDLEAWFGGLTGVWLAAEHGATLRAPGAAWQALRPRMPVDWKARVRPVLEHFADRTPGAFIEEKEYSLVWHHRMSDPEFGEWLANELTANLEDLLAETELRAVRGRKSVEVRLAWANKGEVVERLASLWPGADLVLAVGDDRTDEDLFERAGPRAWTVKVGPGNTRARFRLPGPEDVQRLLEACLAADTALRDGAA